MTDEHNDVQDLVAAYVLGAVTPQEVLMVEEHLRTCADCRQLERELREVEVRLPDLAPEMEPSPALKSRVMAAIAAEPRPAMGERTQETSQPPAGRVRDGAAAPAREPTPWRPRGARPSPRIYALGAVAAVLVLAIAGVAVWKLLGTNSQRTSYAVAGQAPMPTVSGKLYYYPGDKHLELDLSGLKQVPAGRVYELWLVRVNGSKLEPVPVGTFRPDREGTVHERFPGDGRDATSFNVAGLTIERAPRAATPTLPMVASATI